MVYVKNLGALALMAASASAKERKVDTSKEASLYSSGKMHQDIMDVKMVWGSLNRTTGALCG